MHKLVVVQARVGSSRLPGKVLLPLAGEPLLVRMLERVTAAARVDDVVVATTTATEDEPIAELCRSRGLRCFRGHPTDLLDRHLRAAEGTRADAVVKIPSDCPLIDPAVIDEVLAVYDADPGGADLVTNLRPPTWPDGNDVELLPLEVLRVAHREAERSYEREHTTPFVWDRPERFRLRNVRWSRGIDLSTTHRFTIDYPEDYELIARIYDELQGPRAAGPTPFGLDAVLDLLDRRPELLRLNAARAGTSWHDAHLGELSTLRKGPGGAQRFLEQSTTSGAVK